MIDNYISEYGSKIFGFCIQLARNKADAEDLYQETWIKAYRYIEQYDDSKPFMGWLTTICINSHKDLIRKNKVNNFLHSFANTQDYENVINNITIEGDDLTEKNFIYEVISSLPEKYKVVILLHYYQGYKTKEMAEILKIPEGTVKYNLAKARNKLKERLDKNG